MNRVLCRRKTVTGSVWPAARPQAERGREVLVSIMWFPGKEFQGTPPHIPQPWWQTKAFHLSSTEREHDPHMAHLPAVPGGKGQSDVAPVPIPLSGLLPRPRACKARAAGKAEPAPPRPSHSPLLLESGGMLWMSLACPHMAAVNSQIPAGIKERVPQASFNN